MTSCTCTKRSPYDCLAEERGIPYRTSVEAGGCQCKQCGHDEWPQQCGCLHPDPVECAKLQGHNVFVYCPCAHHQTDRAAPRDVGKPVKIASAVGDLSYGDWLDPEDSEC